VRQSAHANLTIMQASWRAREQRRLLIAAVLLGVGLGGFVDGIVLHQVLQWHHLVSTPVPPDSLPNLEHNTFWDGMFHVGTWAVTVAGVFVLASSDGARNDPGGTRRLIGGMLAGWGGFNLVEGLIDHHVLALHHVRPGPDQLVYDLGFLLVGAGLLLTGIALVRAARSSGVATSR